MADAQKDPLKMEREIPKPPQPKSEDDFRAEEIQKVTVAERAHRERGLVCVITKDGKRHHVLPGKGKDRRALGVKPEKR